MDTLLLACGPEGRGGEGRVSALLPLLDDVRHRRRRGASHLPARRSRQSVHIYFFTDPKGLRSCLSFLRILRALAVKSPARRFTAKTQRARRTSVNDTGYCISQKTLSLQTVSAEVKPYFAIDFATRPDLLSCLDGHRSKSLRSPSSK